MAETSLVAALRQSADPKAVDEIEQLIEHGGKDAIASRVGDPAVMLRNKSVHYLPSGGQGAQSPGLVLAHQARVPGYVGGKDRRETPFDPLFLLWLHPVAPSAWAIVLRTGLGFKGQVNG
jgi:hypothetical protein